MTNETAKLYRVSEVAMQIGVCDMSVRRLIRSGDLQAVKLSRNAVRITGESLERFLASRKAA